MHLYKTFALLIFGFLTSALYAQDSISFQQQEINILKEKIDGLEKSINNSKDYTSSLIEEKAKQHVLQYEKLDNRLNNSIWTISILGTALIALFTFLGRNLLIEFIDKNLESQSKKITTDKINEIITEEWLEKKSQNIIDNAVSLLEQKFNKRSNRIIDEAKSTLERIQEKEEELELRKNELNELDMTDNADDIEKNDSSPLNKLKVSDLVETLYETKSESEFNAEDWFWVARFQDSKGESLNAIKNYTKSINLDSDYVVAWNNRGHMKLKIGKFEEAIIDFNKALELDPSSIAALSNKGYANRELNRLEDALEYFDKALKLRPKDPNLLGLKASVYRKMKKHKKGIKYLEEALKLDPKNSSILNNIGCEKNEIKDFEEAIKYLDDAIEIDKTNANSFAHRAYAYLMLSKLEKAETDNAKALELNPEYDRAYYNHGLIYQAKGKISKACEAWKKALELGFEEAQEKIDEFCADK